MTWYAEGHIDTEIYYPAFLFFFYLAPNQLKLVEGLVNISESLLTIFHSLQTKFYACCFVIFIT